MYVVGFILNNLSFHQTYNLFFNEKSVASYLTSLNELCMAPLSLTNVMANPDQNILTIWFVREKKEVVFRCFASRRNGDSNYVIPNQFYFGANRILSR